MKFYQIKNTSLTWQFGLKPTTKIFEFSKVKNSWSSVWVWIQLFVNKLFQDIDNYIAKASDQSYTTLLTLGRHGLNYATNIVITTALKVDYLHFYNKRNIYIIEWIESY